MNGIGEKQAWWASFYASPEFISDTSLNDEKRTLQQINFITKILKKRHAETVLDACCGWGRHAVPLAKSGFEVTGVDLSDLYLEKARHLASACDSTVHLERRDVRNLGFTNQFDAVLSISTSFGFFESDSKNLETLLNLSRALKRDSTSDESGLLIIDTVAIDACRRIVRRNSMLGNDNVRITFDEPRSRFEKRVLKNIDSAAVSDGFSFRIYRQDELTSMLKRCGFSTFEWFGNYDFKIYDSESPRMICLAC